MGWVFVLILALLAGLGLWKIGRVRGPPLQLVSAGLLLAVAGYAWQGRPSLRGSPEAPVVAEAQAGGEAFSRLRKVILGQFDNGGWWLTIADSFISRGDTYNAVGLLNNAVKRHPKDPDLWIGLGNALVLHSEGMMTPAAQLAFDRAQALSPGNPAPRFFYGLALAEGGRFAEAETTWRQVLASMPPNVSWRPLVEERVRILEQIRAIAEGRMPPPPAQ